MFANLDQYDFIVYMKEQNKLTHELFKNHLTDFITECLDGLKDNDYVDMFNIRISLKDDWMKFCDKEEKDNCYELDKNNEE